MEILSRKNAIAAGELKYFTGKPCKNNHLAPRYVQSSTCEECIHPKTNEKPTKTVGMREQQLKINEAKLKLAQERAAINEAKLKLAQERTARLSLQTELALARQRDREINKERLKTRSELIGYKIRLWDKDVAAYRQIVFSRSAERQPALQLGDVFSSRSPTGREGNSGMYYFHCFIEDRESLYEIGKILFTSGYEGPSDEEIRAKRLAIEQRVEAELSVAEEPPPWKP
jgi:hypothetical protein